MNTDNLKEPQKEQSLIQHLLELRSCLLRAAIGVLIIFIALIGFRNSIYTFISTPLLDALPEGGKMIAIDVITPFLVPIKLVLWLSFFIAIPWVLYQLWSFVAPGLYHKEKRFVFPLIFSSIALFYVGMLFAYYAVMPVMFGFLAKATPVGVEMMTDINQYLSTVLRLFFVFGIAFEIPVAIILLVAVGIVSTKAIQNQRRYIIIGAFVVGAIVTPPDIFSQIFFAIAALILFECGLFVAKRIEKKSN